MATPNTDTTKPGSKAFAAAAAAARGETGSTNTDTDEDRALVPVDADAMLAIAAVPYAQATAELAGYDQAPAFVKLSKPAIDPRSGEVRVMRIVGELLGSGSVEMKEDKFGETPTVRTWIVNLEGPSGTTKKIEFLGAHDLNRKLMPALEAVTAGKRRKVIIARLEDKDVGERRVSQWDVKIGQLPDASRSA